MWYICSPDASIAGSSGPSTEACNWGRSPSPTLSKPSGCSTGLEAHKATNRSYDLTACSPRGQWPRHLSSFTCPAFCCEFGMVIKPIHHKQNNMQYTLHHRQLCHWIWRVKASTSKAVDAHNLDEAGLSNPNAIHMRTFHAKIPQLSFLYSRLRPQYSHQVKFLVICLVTFYMHTDHLLPYPKYWRDCFDLWTLDYKPNLKWGFLVYIVLRSKCTYTLIHLQSDSYAQQVASLAAQLLHCLPLLLEEPLSVALPALLVQHLDPVFLVKAQVAFHLQHLQHGLPTDALVTMLIVFWTFLRTAAVSSTWPLKPGWCSGADCILSTSEQKRRRRYYFS